MFFSYQFREFKPENLKKNMCIVHIYINLKVEYLFVGGGGFIRFELPIYKKRVVKWLMDIGRNHTEELLNSIYT